MNNIKIKLLSVLLCCYIFYSCDPNNKEIIKPKQQPIEEQKKSDLPNQQDTLNISDKLDSLDAPKKPNEFIDIKFTDKIIKINNKYMVVGNCNWEKVASANGIIVAIGNNTSSWDGYYTTSTDKGETWKTPTKFNAQSVKYLAVGNGIFVVLNSKQYFTTSDGINWNSTYFSDNINSYSIIFIDNTFVVGATGRFRVSTDGKTWNTYNTNKTCSWTALGYGNGKYFAADNSSGYFTSSSDGKTWASVSEKFTRYKEYKLAVYGNGTYLISDNYGYAYISTDLTTWTQKTIPSFKSLIFYNGKFVGINGNKMYTSEDGINYTEEEMKDEAGNVISINANDICVISNNI